ncbi:hypothetical protein F5883DRAFT_575311 [Diaporthe sp. PMI_573]|nr:hypothetical protein F5883DRAFT_575311 [Diaporthaceae sp. PMI_573]
MSFAAINTANPSPRSLSKSTTPQSQDDGFSGVTYPVLGEIYQAYYKDAKYDGWWMCTPLPWDAWERQIGINFTFKKANLWRDLPEEQYTVDRVRVQPGTRRTKKVIAGWKGDFRAGGPKVRERVFPMLLFEDVEGEPGNFKFPASPEKSYTFPKSALKALPTEWISAVNLRLPGVYVRRPVGGRDTAERFRERFRAREALRNKKQPGTPKKSRPVSPSSSAVASSPIMTSSAAEASSPVLASSLVKEASREDASREDTEMADAESLSGATAVEGDTAGQPDVLDPAKSLAVVKTPPNTKTPSAAATPQTGREKQWRAVVLGEYS